MKHLIDFPIRLSASLFHILNKIERRGREAKRKRKKLFLVLLMFIPGFLQAQLTIDASDFFAVALAESDTLSGVNEDEIGKRIYFPWIESYDLRMRTDEFNVDQNLYTLRITPSTLYKRKAQKALSAHLSQSPDFGGQEAFCDKLSAVYEDWLALYAIQQEGQLLRTLDTVINDRRRIFEKMAGAYDFDFKELLKLQTDESDLGIALHDLSLEEDRLRAAYGLSGTNEFEFTDFIDIGAMLAVLDVQASDSLSLTYTASQYKKELISKELALEIAESRQVFDFAQVRYEGPHTDLFRERVSLGIGFRIPRSGNSRLKIQELELKQKELDREQTRDAVQREADLYSLRQKLIRDINAFTYYQQTIEAERSQLQNLGTQITKKEGFDPLLLLDIEERHIDTRLKAFRKFEEILSDYLQYMEESGRLCGEMERNFLGQF